MHDLIIIGGGPAGITAGIYAARKKLNALLITKDFFGQIAKTGLVENWPGEISISGIALMQKLEKHLRNFPIEIKTGEKVVAVKKNGQGFLVQTEKNSAFAAKCLIIATGRSARALGIEGEQDFIGKGLSYCSICDAPFFKGKQVAVVGGGNAAFETALDLAKYAEKIYIFEKSAKPTADEILQEQVKATGKTEALLEKELVKIEGRGKVRLIAYKDLKTKKMFQKPIDGVFVQIGSVPATGFLGKLIDFNEQNEIKVNPRTLQTSLEGVFAAGDVIDSKRKQLVIAAGEGAKAALAAYDYLQITALEAL